MQLVLHAPYGSRVNRAWGLALRKKFCQSFNFELQAAATEEGIILSLGPSHSFPLEDVFRYLNPKAVTETLTQAVLDTAKRGALNMHGSLLPKYRGRVPINWAVINGETETGATLHYMTAKPDAGDIVGQQAVAIGPDETAAHVFRKVTAAAAQVLDRHLPGLIAGTAPRIVQDLKAGAYFGGRKPADGRIDWTLPAARAAGKPSKATMR